MTTRITLNSLDEMKTAPDMTDKPIVYWRKKSLMKVPPGDFVISNKHIDYRLIVCYAKIAFTLPRDQSRNRS